DEPLRRLCEVARELAMRIGPASSCERRSSSVQLRKWGERRVQIAPIPSRRTDRRTRAIDRDARGGGGAPGQLRAIHARDAREELRHANSPPRRTRGTRGSFWFCSQ